MIAKIRTSDRATFKRCRRKWDFSSNLRQNLEENSARSPLWFGSGFHYAMEDYHGYNKYGSTVAAFDAYVEAHRRMPGKVLPVDWEDLVKLGHGMLDYYQQWLSTRDPLKTYWRNDEPQVEVNFEIELPIDVSGTKYEKVIYSGTIDKVTIDEQGRLWLLDYKTAQQFSRTHLDVDAQINAYCWAASCIYELPVAGFIYQQHKKVIPELPQPLLSGHLSVNKAQNTTHRLYRNAMVEVYGEVAAAPLNVREFLNTLAAQETDSEDKLICRDFEYRNANQLSSTGTNILAEVQDMIRTDLPLYPNPTRDCVWDCPFRTACVAMEDGSDWELEIQTGFQQRNAEERNWRNYLI